MKSLNILCERTMKAEMHKFKKDPGINEKDVRQSAEMYACHKARKVQTTKVFLCEMRLRLFK